MQVFYFPLAACGLTFQQHLLDLLHIQSSMDNIMHVFHSLKQKTRNYNFSKCIWICILSLNLLNFCIIQFRTYQPQCLEVTPIHAISPPVDSDFTHLKRGGLKNKQKQIYCRYAFYFKALCMQQYLTKLIYLCIVVILMQSSISYK